MANKVAELLKKIEFQTDLNLEEIADKIGYSREHLTKAKNNKGGKMNIEGVYDALVANFPETSQTVISAPTLSDKDKIIALLEERVTSLKEDNESLKRRLNLVAAAVLEQLSMIHAKVETNQSLLSELMVKQKVVPTDSIDDKIDRENAENFLRERKKLEHIVPL